MTQKAYFFRRKCFSASDKRQADRLPKSIHVLNRDGFLAVDHFAGKAVDQIDIVQPARFVVSGRCVENLAGRQDGRQRKEQWTSISSASCE
jgi:hypothetical protein